jgi:subtilisin family serine protease
MRITSLLAPALLTVALAVTGCGSDEEDSNSSDAVDPAESSDSSDPTDAASSSDPSDPADASDSSDPSDPTQATDPAELNCSEYLDCIDGCWTNDPDEVDSCFETCDETAKPEALEAADAYYNCLDDCEVNAEDDEQLEVCYQEECEPLYIACIAPPECVPACAHYDEICGEDGPLYGERSYWASGRRYALQTSTQEFVVALNEASPSTPDILGVERIEQFDSLHSKDMLVAHFKAQNVNAQTFTHPSIRGVYPVFTNSRGERLLSTDEILFHAPDQTAADLAPLLEQLKLTLVRSVKGLPQTWLARALFEDSISACDRLRDNMSIKWASPNFLRQHQLRYIPNDPFLSEQWHHSNDGEGSLRLAGADMRTTFAWDITTGNQEVSIAINDDGVDLRHPDIPFMRDSDSQIIGVNLPTDIDDNLAEGCCNHGTSVAGVSAAIADNATGTVGVCPGCSVIPVWTDFGSPNEDLAVAETFTESTANGAWAINNSWGPPDGNPAVLESPAAIEPVPDIIDQALRDVAENGRDGKGTVVIFAAGNGNEDVLSDPYVTHPLTIGVASVNARGIKSSYSDFGEAVWVAAPSDGNHLMPGIVTSDVLGDLGYASTGNPEALDPSGDVTADFGGTSSAAPAVTGLVGLIFSVNPDLTAMAVKDILRRTSRKIDKANGLYEPDGDGFLKSPFYGYGLIDAHAAVRAALIGCAPDDPNLCVPAATCTDSPLELVPEICNGIDDNCDGTIDEGACGEPTAIGQACDLRGDCQDSCTWLENDPLPYCAGDCAEGCPEGHVCSGDLCVPETGRLSPESSEICDGYDNNLDGAVDEIGCDPSTDGTCEYTAQCDSSNGPVMCVEGFCAPVCETTDDCDSGVECQEVASQYGSGADISICAPSLDSGLTCIDACIFLHENAPGAIFQSITNCITEAATCDDAIACVPL